GDVIAPEVEGAIRQFHLKTLPPKHLPSGHGLARVEEQERALRHSLPPGACIGAAPDVLRSNQRHVARHFGRAQAEPVVVEQDDIRMYQQRVTAPRHLEQIVHRLPLIALLNDHFGSARTSYFGRAIRRGIVENYDAHPPARSLADLVKTGTEKCLAVPRRDADKAVRMRSGENHGACLFARWITIQHGEGRTPRRKTRYGSRRNPCGTRPRRADPRRGRLLRRCPPALSGLARAP